jgi:endonuclease III related protein
MAARTGELLQELYQKMLQAFGPQGWWPGETPFEVALGAILTQNTNWNNVARVIQGLKEAGLLDPSALQTLPEEELALRLKPAGYFNIKARRIKSFLDFLGQFQGSMELLAREDPETLRPALLQVKGVGPETADSILLYALNQPTFVVDAYTFRILWRHGLMDGPSSYEDLRQFFMERLAPQVPLFQEYHALLVRLGKEFCRPRPRCDACPLQGWPQGWQAPLED